MRKVGSGRYELPEVKQLIEAIKTGNNELTTIPKATLQCALKRHGLKASIRYLINDKNMKTYKGDKIVWKVEKKVAKK
jgi:hypothetical protein